MSKMFPSCHNICVRALLFLFPVLLITGVFAAASSPDGAAASSSSSSNHGLLSSKRDLSLFQKEDSQKEDSFAQQEKKCRSIVIEHDWTGELLYDEEEEGSAFYYFSIDDLARKVEKKGLQTGQILTPPEGYETKITFVIRGNHPRERLNGETLLGDLFDGKERLNLLAVISEPLQEKDLYFLDGRSEVKIHPILLCEAAESVGMKVKRGELDLDVALDLFLGNLQNVDNDHRVISEIVSRIAALCGDVGIMKSDSDQNIAARTRIIDVYLKYIKHGKYRYYDTCFGPVFAAMVYRLEELNVKSEEIFEHLLSCLERDIMSTTVITIIHDADRRRRELQRDYSFSQTEGRPNCYELMRVMRDLEGPPFDDAYARINQVFIRRGRDYIGVLSDVVMKCIDIITSHINILYDT